MGEEKTKLRICLKTVIKSIVVLLGGCILGSALLMAAFLLPVQPMQRHVESSIGLMDVGDVFPLLSGGRVNMRMDTYTDSLMLNSAVVQTDDNVPARALRVYHVTGGTYTSPDSQLLEYLQSEDDRGFSMEPYGRYWHGYLVTLKTALLFLDYGHIRTLNMYVQILLAFFVCDLFRRRVGARYALAFVLASFCLTPAVLPQSLQYSTVFYILLCTLLLILRCHDWFVESDRYPLLFLLIGMATSYMDLLTYPLVTLGVPLAAMLLLDRESSTATGIRNCIVLSLFWCIGYFGFWALKWCVGTLVTGIGFFTDALNSAAERASIFGEGVFERLVAAWANIKVFAYKPNLLLIATVGILLVVLLYTKRVCLRRCPMKNSGAFLFVACYPFIWLLVFANHSTVHYWFTHRVFMVTAFALLCQLMPCIVVRREKQ